MPYIPGKRVHGVVHVKDLYNSPNVFANQVAVGLWQEAGLSSAFAYDVPAITVSVTEFSPAYIAEAQNLPPQQISKESIANNVVEQGYRGTPTSSLLSDPPTQTTGAVPSGKVEPQTGEPNQLIIPESTASGDPVELVEWLRARLIEGQRGMWNRLSPPAPARPVSPGNPNIIEMWKSVGLRQFTNNDQTPWCAGFMNFALKQSGYKWLQDASSWTIRNSPGKYGATAIPLNQGQPGDIALFSFGHVAFVNLAVNGAYSFIGGNQSGGQRTAKTPNNNNPVQSCVSESWVSPDGRTPYYKNGGDRSLVGLWRPGKV